MKNLSYCLLFVFAFIVSTIPAHAKDHPQANFGEYGIKHYSTISEYQREYVGKVVKYIPRYKGGSYCDEKYFQKAGGKFNVEYIIEKIKGNDKRMKFFLREKNGKSKVQMTINNEDLYYSYGKYCYCITSTYSVPLFLSEKFEAEKSSFIGKVYPESIDSPVKFEVIDVILKTEEYSNEYPLVCYVLKDKNDESILHCEITNSSELNELGTVFSNPKFKCTYTITNIFRKEDHDSYYKKFYTVKNSIDGTTKDIKAAYASTEAFKGDNNGKFIVTLTKVEKPSNPAVRYGKTTNITEKDITKFSYKDNFIDIIIFAGSTQFNFI